MKALDTQGHFDDYLNDQSLLLSKDEVNNICKISQGILTCRYLGLGNNGYFCAKNTPFKDFLDEMASNKTLIARSDNCQGKIYEKKNKESHKKNNQEVKKNDQKGSEENQV